MGALLSTIILLLASTVCYSQGGKPATCEEFEQLARAIMQARQEGNSMAKLMKITKKENPSELDKFELKITSNLIIEAYEQPQYHTDEMKTRAVQDFANDVYLQCVKGKLRK